MAVVPFARSILLCEELDEEGGLTNLYGVFNALRRVGFSYQEDGFVAYTQLVGGLGEVTLFVDIRRAADDLLIHTTTPQRLTFARRTQQIQVAVHLVGITFPTPGVYLVQLFCNNAWVADVTLKLIEDKP